MSGGSWFDWSSLISAALVAAILGVAVFLALRRARAGGAAPYASDEARRKAELDVARLEETVRAGNERHAELAAQFEEQRARTDEARANVEALSKELATLTERREREAEHAESRIKELTEAREKMSHEFKTLAEEVMARHGQTFKQQNREQLDHLLNPLREKIVEFQSGMTEAQKQAAEGRVRLAEQIRHLSENSTRMTEETVNLTRALKGNAQVRGAWGEMILARILEASGLRAGEEFVIQESETLEEGERLRPDAVVNLPGERRLVIDSKLSLIAYERYANAADEETRVASLRDHVSATASHIRDLSGKDYTRISGITPDYVIMFFPIEGAFAAALGAEKDLTEMALRQNITLAAPTTLITILRSVAHLWQVDRQHRNAEEIAHRAGALYDKFVGFNDSLENVGEHLKKASAAHLEATKRLATGRGNLVRQAEELRHLGARAKKRLPDETVRDSDTPMLESAAD